MRFNSMGDTIDNLPNIRRTPHHHLTFSPSFHHATRSNAGILGVVLLALRRLSWPPVGPRGRLSILVVGPVAVSGPSSSSADPGGGSSWPIVVGAHCVSWGLSEKTG